MNSYCMFMYRIGLAVLVVLFAAGVSRGALLDNAAEADTDSAAVSGKAEEKPEFEEQQSVPARIETHTLVDAYSGYRFFHVNRYGGNAAPYEYLHSNPVYYGSVNYLAQDIRMSLEGGYLNDKDYHGDLTYDYKGIYRFKFWTESLFHNLGHAQLFDSPFTVNGNSYSPIDLNPRGLYGVRVEQDVAQFRYKPEQFPLHLNFGYWRMLREGTSQMIFADHGFEGTANTFFSKTRVIDRQTHEGQFGFDAHLGYIDLIYDFRVREFKDHTGVPRDSFSDRLDPTESMPRSGGILDHSDTPDSRFYSHKVGLHTSMSGGLVGAVSYTFGKRENLASLNDIRGVDQTNTITHNVAGDLSYTPCGSFSCAVKYRRFEIERNSPATVLYTPAVSPQVGVRPAINTQKDTITASFVYRPVTLLTLKGEYKGEFLSRDNIDPWVVPGRIATLSYPEHSDIHTGSLTLLSRPFKGLRAMAQYLYSTADHPAFANAYEEKHEGLFQLTYTATSRWGVTANTRISRENSDHVKVTTLDFVNPSVTFQMPKNKKLSNATLSTWFVPLKNLTVTGSCGLLRSSSDEAVLFASFLPGSNVLTNYTQQTQFFAVNSMYHVDEKIDLSLGLQQVRSKAEFDPQFVSFGPTANTAGIKQVSQLKTVESSLSTRADYRFTRNFSCALEYSFKDYDEKISSLFNGSVNTVMLYLAGKW